MTASRMLTAAGLAFVFVLGACSSSETIADAGATARIYGPAQNVGNGTVRTYVVLDKKDPNTPLEIGVAMSEAAMDNLPTAVPSNDPMANMHMYTLVLPAQNPTPYKFVQFDWNPAGHEPAGVYDLPHFDFHFYTVPVATRDGILPTDPQYAAKAARYPDSTLRAPFYIDAATPAGIPASAAAVPQMGLHWLDVRSPEL